MGGALGWSGWIAIVLLPFSFWAAIVAFLVVLFRSEAPLDVEVEEEVPVLEPSRERSGLGWVPTVASHQR